MTDVSRVWHIKAYGEKDGKKIVGEFIVSAKSENRLRKLFKGRIEILRSERTDKDRIIMDLGVREVK